MRKFLLIALMALGLGSSAQTLLGGAEFSAKLPKKFSVSAGVEYRSTNWFDNTDQWNIEAAAGYKPLKWLKLSAGYKLIQAWNPAGETKKGYAYKEYWDNKHRANISVSGSLKLGRVELSLRERYQYTFRPSHDIQRYENDSYSIKDGIRTINAKSSHILRSRLQAEFKTGKKSPWKPFASFELYSMLADVNHTENRSDGAKFYDKLRAAAGCTYKINKHNALELFYRYTRSVDPDENDAPHTIALVYSFSL